MTNVDQTDNTPRKGAPKKSPLSGKGRTKEKRAKWAQQYAKNRAARAELNSASAGELSGSKLADYTARLKALSRGAA